MNHAPGVGSIVQPNDLQSSTLWLRHDFPHWIIEDIRNTICSVLFSNLSAVWTYILILEFMSNMHIKPFCSLFLIMQYYWGSSNMSMHITINVLIINLHYTFLFQYLKKSQESKLQWPSVLNSEWGERQRNSLNFNLETAILCFMPHPSHSFWGEGK